MRTGKLTFYRSIFYTPGAKLHKKDQKCCILRPCAIDSISSDSNFYAYVKMKHFPTHLQLFRQSPSKWDQKCCILRPCAIDSKCSNSNFYAHVKMTNFFDPFSSKLNRRWLRGEKGSPRRSKTEPGRCAANEKEHRANVGCNETGNQDGADGSG